MSLSLFVTKKTKTSRPQKRKQQKLPFFVVEMSATSSLQSTIGDESDLTHVSDVDDGGRAAAASPPAVPSGSMRRSVFYGH